MQSNGSRPGAPQAGPSLAAGRDAHADRSATMLGLRKLIAGIAKPGGSPARDARPGTAGGAADALAQIEASIAAGRFGDALRASDEARAADPGSVLSALARAWALFTSGRHREAPGGPPRTWRGWPGGTRCNACAWAGSHSMRATLLRPRPGCAAPRPQGPGEYDAEIHLAACLHAQDNCSDAEAAYRRALAARPADFDALVGLGSCLLEEGDAERRPRPAFRGKPRSSTESPRSRGRSSDARSD